MPGFIRLSTTQCCLPIHGTGLRAMWLGDSLVRPLAQRAMLADDYAQCDSHYKACCDCPLRLATKTSMIQSAAQATLAPPNHSHACNDWRRSATGSLIARSGSVLRSGDATEHNPRRVIEER
jgi:hypothetical protein